MFTVYLLVVAALTIVPARVGPLGIPRANHYNFIPFGFSFTCLLQLSTIHPSLVPFCLKNTLGNIALFLPLGILLPLASARYRSLKRTLFLAVCFSVAIEMVQFFAWFIGNTRAADIDDVLLNTMGACLGFLVYRLLIGKRQTVDSKQSTANSRQ